MEDQTTDNSGTALAESKPTSVIDINAIFQSMMEMAKNPNVDADKMKTIFEMQKEMRADEAKSRFDRAMALACQQMPVITKDSKIEHNGRFIAWFKKYEDIRVVVDGICKPLGLTIRHSCKEMNEGRMLGVNTIVTFVDSEFTHVYEGPHMPVPFDTGGAKSGAQGAGSSQKYGERYSLCSTFGIIQQGLDNDGRSVGANQSSAVTQIDVGNVDSLLMAAAGKGTQALNDFWKSKTLSPMQKGYAAEKKVLEKAKLAAAEADVKELNETQRNLG